MGYVSRDLDNRLFVADNNQGLWIADITDPIHPVPFLSDSLKTAAVGLAYKEPNLYLVDISGKLLIYDLSDPAKFNLIGQLDLPQLSTDLIIDGDYAFPRRSGWVMGGRYFQPEFPGEDSRPAISDV